MLIGVVKLPDMSRNSDNESSPYGQESFERNDLKVDHLYD